MWLGRIRKGGSNHTVCVQTVDNCLFKRTLQRTAQPLRWGIYINQEPPESSCPIKCLPPPKVRWIVSLPGLFLSPLSLVWGRGHLCGVQLAVLISRCQGVEHDLAHQLVGTRQTRESLYRCPQGPSPRNKTQWGLGGREGGREGSFYTHRPRPAPPTTTSYTRGKSPDKRKSTSFHSGEEKLPPRGKEKSDHKDVLKCFPNSRVGKDKLRRWVLRKIKGKVNILCGAGKINQENCWQRWEEMNVRSPSWFHRTDSQGCVNGCYCTSPWKGSNMQDPLWMSTNPVSN